MDERINSAIIIERLEGIHTAVDALNVKVGIQNGRVSKLENWKYWIMGGLAVIGIILLPMLGFLAVNVISTSNMVAALAAKDGLK